MGFYKVICEEAVVGVGQSCDFRKHQVKHNILIGATENDAQYIEVGMELYWDVWMQEPDTDEFPYKTATVKGISEEEYKIIAKAISENESIPEDPEETEDVEEEIEEGPVEEEPTADYVRSVKIREMSLACNQAIIEGFDLELGGEPKHFSLTLKDQTNLVTATVQILSGEQAIPYHADGDELKNFTADEMLQVIGAANAHKTYHLVYFNCMKKWLNALSRITSIQAVEYGAEIPKKYQSGLYKTIAG